MWRKGLSNVIPSIIVDEKPTIFGPVLNVEALLPVYPDYHFAWIAYIIQRLCIRYKVWGFACASYMHMHLCRENVSKSNA